jgi:mono/diheme cytochrome c family protein
MTVRSTPLAALLLLWAIAISLTGATLAAEAEEPAGAVSYYEQIRPIFQAQCQGCHQPAKAGGEYVMTSFAELTRGGESEQAAIVPKAVADSYLIDQITPNAEGQADMPKGKPPLSTDEIALITRWIAEGAVDDTPAGARTVHNADNPPVYQSPPVITSLDFSSDGQFLAVSGYHEVLLHKADGSELVARLIGMSERIESVRFSPDSKLLAVTGGQPGRMGELQIWDVAKRALRVSTPVTFDTVYGASWSPDGKLVALGCSDNTVRAFDAQTGKQVLFNGAHSDWVLDTVFSVDGKHLVSVGRDMTAKLHVVAEQRFVDNITSITPGALKGGILSVRRHPTKNELLLGGADGAPKVYKMFREKARKIGDDFNKIRDFEKMPGRVFAVAFSPDGERVLAGSSSDGQGEVRLYQTADGKLLWTYPTQSIYAVAYRADGQAIAIGGSEGAVRLLNPADGEPISEFAPAPIKE